MQNGERTVMTFSDFRIVKNVIKGSGSDIVGAYKIQGSVANGQVKFEKTYVG